MDTTEPLITGDEIVRALRRSAQEIFDRRSIRDLEATLDQLDDAAAFEMLVSSSQNTNVKLTAVAQWLVGEAKQRYAGRPDTGGDDV